MRTNWAQRHRDLAMWLGLLSAWPAWSQKVQDPRASVLNVTAQRAALAGNTDPVVQAAVAHLPSCVALPLVPAPQGEMLIPKHYLADAHGPINPAEAAATRVYTAFAVRITGGMNRWVATGDEAEASCALHQLSAWAQAGALLRYDRQTSPQAWYQVEWTASSAGITASVLAQDATLDPAEQQRVASWLRSVVWKDLWFERNTDTRNNHHYWRGLAATAVGVTAGDDRLFKIGVDTYKRAVRDIAADGSFPNEMARHERALHYQIFALEPLLLTAEFAERQGVNLYAFSAHSRTLRDALVFFGNALANPELVRRYASEDQVMDFKAGDFTAVLWYAARFGTAGLPLALQNGIRQPCSSTNLGGSATVLAATSTQ